MSVDGRRRGLFIAFEGPEGSGKSTQAQMLADRLQQAGLDVLLTREPGGTELGERLRALMFRERSLPEMNPRVQALLMLAARAQHVAERLRPWLNDGGVVVCDRFAASTLAYQGAGFGLEISELDQMNAFATAGVLPDVTLLLDLDVQIGVMRSLKQRGSDWEKAGGMNAQKLEFHARVRRGYLEQAETDGWAVLDATQSPEDLSQEIWRRVEPEIGARTLRAAEAVQPPLPLAAGTAQGPPIDAAGRS
ncbi:MAG: dTMP kinase [Chloroflexi bacterium]|nr:dTMP kinase [Chloroflexota bacterium]